MTLGAAGEWCVVLDCCIPHLELATGLSVMAHVHGLPAGDVNLEEVSGCQLLKSVLIL